jgi:hypothetical protein
MKQSRSSAEFFCPSLVLHGRRKNSIQALGIAAPTLDRRRSVLDKLPVGSILGNESRDGTA